MTDAGWTQQRRSSRSAVQRAKDHAGLAVRRRAETGGARPHAGPRPDPDPARRAVDRPRPKSGRPSSPASDDSPTADAPFLLVEQNARSGLAAADFGAVLEGGVVRLTATGAEPARTTPRWPGSTSAGPVCRPDRPSSSIGPRRRRARCHSPPSKVHDEHSPEHSRLDRHRPDGRRDGRPAARGRRGRHRLEPHPRQGRAARRRGRARSPTRSSTSPTATSSSRWCPRSADLEQVLRRRRPADRPATGARASSSTARPCRPSPPRGCARPCAARGVAVPRRTGQRQRQGGRGRQAQPGRAPVREETYDEVEPLLDLLGRHVTYVGEGDLARLVKICHNLMLGVVTQYLAEITVLAEKGGVPRAAFLDFLNNSVMGSMFTRYKSPAFVNLDYTPTFTPVLLRKDFDLGLAAAHELDVPMPVAAAAAAAGAGRGRAAAASTRTSPSCSSCRRAAPGSSSSPRTSTVDDGLVPRGATDRERARCRRPGTWASTTSSASTSTGCATTGSAGPRTPLEASECGAFLLFDFYNIRYTTQTWIGGALGDKMIRYALLARGKDPGAVGLRLGRQAPPALLAVAARARTTGPGFLGLRGAVAPTVGLMGRRGRARSSRMLVDAGVADQPVGVDIVEPPFLFEMQRQGLTCRRRPAAHARRAGDQVRRRDHAAHPGRGDGRRRLPGHRRGAEARHPRERDRRARQQAALRDGLGPGRGDQRDLRRAVQPAPAQLHRPADPSRRPGVLRHHPLVQRLPDLLLPHVRGRQLPPPAQRDAYTKAREWMDRGIDGLKAGVGTDEVAALLPKAEEFGFDNEMEAFGLQFAHGLGLGLHERPIISRLNSMKEPIELRWAWCSRWRPTARRQRRLLGGADRGGGRRHRGRSASSSRSSRRRTSSSPTPTDRAPRGGVGVCRRDLVRPRQGVHGASSNIGVAAELDPGAPDVTRQEPLRVDRRRGVRWRRAAAGARR